MVLGSLQCLGIRPAVLYSGEGWGAFLLSRSKPTHEQCQ